MAEATICKAWLHDPHDDRAGGPADVACMVRLELADGHAEFRVSSTVFDKLTVGAKVEVPDDLRSAHAGSFVELTF